VAPLAFRGKSRSVTVSTQRRARPYWSSSLAVRATSGRLHPQRPSTFGSSNSLMNAMITSSCRSSCSQRSRRVRSRRRAAGRGSAAMEAAGSAWRIEPRQRIVATSRDKRTNEREPASGPYCKHFRERSEKTHVESVRRYVIMGMGLQDDCAEQLRKIDAAASIIMFADEPYPLYNRIALPPMLRKQVTERRSSFAMSRGTRTHDRLALSTRVDAINHEARPSLPAARNIRRCAARGDRWASQPLRVFRCGGREQHLHNSST